MLIEQQTPSIREMKIDGYTVRLQFAAQTSPDLIQNIEDLLINSVIQKEISGMDKTTNIWDNRINSTLTVKYWFEIAITRYLNNNGGNEVAKRVYCLYRVSTTQQVDKSDNKADIPMQRIECRRLCEREGWTI